MKSMQGLHHETSLQNAQGRPTTLTSVAVAGQKRSRSNNDDESKPPEPKPQAGVKFQRAASVPGAPSRLQPSRIINLERTQGMPEYSQRRVIAATPTSSVDPELSLAHATYELPPQLVENFASQGIKQIYPWQKTCLKGPGLLTGTKNLVYCAPTGGGKSLVADCRQIVCRRIL